MNRTDVLRHIAGLRNGAPMIISPGLANYPIAEAKDEPLTIYNMDMPYTTPMALGIALGWPERKVISIEGDGSLLAGPGVLSTVARYQPKNLLMLVFDNGAYLTTGSGKAPTATVFGTDIEQLGRAAGLTNTRTVRDLDAATRRRQRCVHRAWTLVDRRKSGQTRSSGRTGTAFIADVCLRGWFDISSGGVAGTVSEEVTIEKV